MLKSVRMSHWCLARSISVTFPSGTRIFPIFNETLKTLSIFSPDRLINHKRQPFYITRRFTTETSDLVDALKFEDVCEETLESLCEYFEDLIEKCPHLKGSDVVFGDGVLTVVFGEPYGTYVINRQTPNRQVWLSSPTSGPKRYDFIMKGDGYWMYKHDGVTLHQLLQKEINEIVKNQADFSKCAHSLV